MFDIWVYSIYKWNCSVCCYLVPSRNKIKCFVYIQKAVVTLHVDPCFNMLTKIDFKCLFLLTKKKRRDIFLSTLCPGSHFNRSKLATNKYSIFKILTQNQRNNWKSPPNQFYCLIDHGSKMFVMLRLCLHVQMAWDTP